MLAQADDGGGWTGIVVGGILGIAGALAGVLLEHVLRNRGRVQVVTGRLYAYGRAVGPVHSAIDDYLRLLFKTQFYNSKGEPTGLRDLKVVVERDGQVLDTHPPRMRPPRSAA